MNVSVHWQQGYVLDATHAIAHTVRTGVAVATGVVAVRILTVDLTQLLGL